MSEVIESDAIDLGSAGDPSARKNVRDAQDARKKRQAADAVAVCSTSEGRRFMAYLLSDIGLYRKAPFTDSIRLAAINEARTAMALHLRGVVIATGLNNWMEVELELLKRESEFKEKV